MQPVVIVVNSLANYLIKIKFLLVTFTFIPYGVRHPVRIRNAINYPWVEGRTPGPPPQVSQRYNLSLGHCPGWLVEASHPLHTKPSRAFSFPAYQDGMPEASFNNFCWNTGRRAAKYPLMAHSVSLHFPQTANYLNASTATILYINTATLIL